MFYSQQKKPAVDADGVKLSTLKNRKKRERRRTRRLTALDNKSSEEPATDCSISGCHKVIVEPKTTAAVPNVANKAKNKVLPNTEVNLNEKKSQEKSKIFAKSDNKPAPSLTSLLASTKEVFKELSTVTSVLEKTDKLTNLVELKQTEQIISKPVTLSTPNMTNTEADKTREKVLAEREAKKMAKLAAKNKGKSDAPPTVAATTQPVVEKVTKDALNSSEKSREQIQAEREAKKAEKQQHKKKPDTADLKKAQNMMENIKISAMQNSKETKETKNDEPESAEVKAKPVLSKAERRAIQEAQRAAKATAQADKNKIEPKVAAKSNNKSVSRDIDLRIS